MNDLKQTLTILFGVSIAIANVTAAKLSWFILPFIGGVAVPAGFAAIGVAFLCSDLITEFYGREYAHSVVNGTIISLIAAYALIWVAIVLPVAPFYGAHGAYVTTLGSSSAIVLASVISLFVSQHTDVTIFSRLKERTDGRHKWLRNLGSTTLSQLVDTVIFISLAFAIIPSLLGQEAIWGMALLSIIIGQYVVKLIVAFIDTPIFYLLSWFGD